MDAIFYALALLYVLFVLYLAYVALWVAHTNGKLAAAPIYVRIVSWSVLGCAVVLDVVFNVTVGSVIFLQLPARSWLTVTARCSRWRYDLGYRGRLARWMCESWLNPFHEHHC